MIATNRHDIDFFDAEIKSALGQRKEDIPVAVKKMKTFVNKSTKTPKWICPIDSLEFAILVASELEHVPELPNMSFKEFYVSKILEQNVHTIMEKIDRSSSIPYNITAMHLAMIGISDISIMLSVVKMISKKQPHQLNTLTGWKESVLHYLLGSESKCLEPLDMLKYCRTHGVMLNTNAETDFGSCTADHLLMYKASKWFAGHQRAEVLTYLRKWRESDHPDTYPTCEKNKSEASPEGRDMHYLYLLFVVHYMYGARLRRHISQLANAKELR